MMSTSGGQAITNVPASLPEVDHESGHESDRNAEEEPRKTNLLFPGEQHPILTIEPPSPMPDDHSHSCSKTFCDRYHIRTPFSFHELWLRDALDGFCDEKIGHIIYIDEAYDQYGSIDVLSILC